MKLVYKSLYLLTVIALFSHCKKEGNNDQVVIKGRITDALTGDAANDVSIKLFIKGIVDGVFNNNFQLIAEDQSDVNGNYQIQFSKGTPTTYRFQVSGDGYYNLQQDENPDDFSVNNENEFDLEINSRAWLKVRVVDEGTVNNGDMVTFGLSTENNACENCCSSSIIEISGSVDDTQVCELFGGSYAYVNGVAVDANFGPMDIHDSVLIQPFDTTMMTISF